MASELRWIRSSYSSAGNDNCLESASDGVTVWIRDSKDARQRFDVSLVSWRAFLVDIVQT
jgi:hypothetical protein